MAAEDEHISVGSWKGLQNYECTLCGFASLDKLTTIGHIKMQHYGKPRPVMKPELMVLEVVELAAPKKTVKKKKKTKKGRNKK